LSATDREIAAAVAELRSRLGSQVVAEHLLPARPASFGELAAPLPEALADALRATGVERLYDHQARALEVARAGRNLLLTTATASGKSLAFQLPVLEEALAGGPRRALWLFPLKALGQDQRAKLETLAAAAGLADGRCRIEIYDGDTPSERRAAIRRDPPRVLVTNPDMLHLGILPNAGSWSPFLAELGWVVLDELHAYRGLFGAHVHHVLRRLDRLARAEGASPSYVAASATASEADEFAGEICGAPFEWIRESGAPREARHFLLIRPSVSPYSTALDVLSTLLESGQKTIVFTKARRITELLYSWLARRSPDLARRVKSYRAGFLPSERRAIERGLASGRLDGVISTSALELGIDIGGLDACVLVGWPGSVMATWQRSGRVGRSGRESLTVLVALPDALDQYLLDHPAELLDRPCERLVVDPANEFVARRHLVCAAAERPLAPDADRDYLERHAPVVGDLLRAGELLRSEEGDRLLPRRRRPQRDVSLRGAGASVAIVDESTGATIGTIDGSRVFAECHPGAIYLHAGRQWGVVDLDVERGIATVRAADVDWFTSPLSEKETEILEVLDARRVGGLDAAFGRLLVTERVVGFERKKTHGVEVIDRQPLELPPVRFESQGLWFRAPEGLIAALEAAAAHPLGSLHAAEHAAIGLFPLVALCDRNDLGGISLSFHPQLNGAGVFVYEGHEGGVGICRKGFQELPALLASVAELVNRCPCDDGCPSCIQSPKCGNGNRPLDKRGARLLVECLLEEVASGAWAASRGSAASASTGPPVSAAPVARPVKGSRAGASASDGPNGANASMDGEGESTVVALRDSPAPRARRAGSGASAPRRPRPARRDEARATGAERTAVERGLRSESSSEGPAPSALESSRLGASGETTRPGPANGASGIEPARARRAKRASAGEPRKTVLFDLETLRSAEEVGGWNRAHRMGIALGVVLHLEEGRFETYREDRVPDLVADLKGADLVVGFNSRRFDYAVLSGYTGEDYGRTLPTLDLLETLHGVLGFRVGLNHLAQETLGRGKSADGLQSLEWVKQGRFDLIEDYCRQDVEVLRDVYLFGRREGYVLIRSRGADRVRVPVDW